MQILLTFDYELFFGANTGTVQQCMIQPTNTLLDLSERYRIPMTFFVDAGFLACLAEYQSDFPELTIDLSAIEEQMERMQVLGCDIQLHIHPHWERSFYDGEKWVIQTDYCYKLADFSDQEAEAIVRKYHATLQKWVKKPLSSYRAGGWCIQPFSQVAQVFRELGIDKDSSVFPGGSFSSAHYDFDFTAVPVFSDAYRFESDVCVVDEKGFFTEIPIASWKYSPLFYWKLYVLGRLFPHRHKMLGDGSFLAQPGRKQSVLTSYTWNHVSCDGYYAAMLQCQLKTYQAKNNRFFVVIGHPKGMTHFSLRKLEQFIAKATTTHRFTVYSSPACTI
jgi:peptidoglycan/xylan/chitin deacetylase (PgdA/CDA1 family)